MATLDSTRENDNSYGRNVSHGRTLQAPTVDLANAGAESHQQVDPPVSQQQRQQDMSPSRAPGNTYRVEESKSRQGEQQQRQQSNTQPYQQLQPMVVDLQTISNDIISLLESVRNTPETKTLWAKISMPYRFLLMKTSVFRFTPRPIVHRQEQGGGFSTAADFFVKNLARSKPGLVRDLGVLAGLRCSYCLQSPQYVSGATNFVALCQDTSVDMLVTAMDGRRRHFLQCPWAPNSLKQVLGQVATPDEIAQLRQFLKMWHNVVSQKHFTPTVPSAANTQMLNPGGLQPVVQRPQIYQQTSITNTYRPKPRPIPMRPMFDEGEALSELNHSFSVARKLCLQGSGVIFENLTLLPTPHQGMETPRVEVILQSFAMSIRKEDRMKKTSIEDMDNDILQQHRMADESDQVRPCLWIQCRYCDGENRTSLDRTDPKYCVKRGALDISELITGNNKDADEELASRLLLMGVSHHRHCRSMPRMIRQNLARCLPTKDYASDQANMLALLSKWKIQLQHEFLPRSVPSLEASPDADLWGAVTNSKLLSAWVASTSRSLLKTEQLAGTRPQGMVVPDVSFLGENDVLTEDEFLRELEGNRRFRNLISEHREFFDEVEGEEQEQVIVEALAKVINRRGGNFFSLLPLGPPSNRRLIPLKLSEVQAMGYVYRKLLSGFSDLLRPPMDLASKGAGSRCTHIEHAPLVGKIHQSIRWMKEEGVVMDAGATATLISSLDRNPIHFAKSQANCRSESFGYSTVASHRRSYSDLEEGSNPTVEQERERQDDEQSGNSKRLIDPPERDSFGTQIVSPIIPSNNAGIPKAIDDSQKEPAFLKQGAEDNSATMTSDGRKRSFDIDGRVAKRARYADPNHRTIGVYSEESSPAGHESQEHVHDASIENKEIGKENFPARETALERGVEGEDHTAPISVSAEIGSGYEGEVADSSQAFQGRDTDVFFDCAG